MLSATVSGADSGSSGGAQPRRRPREANASNSQQQQQQSPHPDPPLLRLASLFNFGGPSNPPMLQMVYDSPLPLTYVHGCKTATLGINYFVDLADLEDWTEKNQQPDCAAEVNLVRYLCNECEHETTYRQRLREQA
jgi:hypothetical protein